MRKLLSVALLSTLILPANAQKQHPSLPILRVPQGAGVNIHFTDAKAGEMEMLSAAYRFVRMDFHWGGTEKTKGIYDFSAYDRLLKACDEHKVRALFILDYNNPFYDDGLSPHSGEGRAAMANWAAAAATHFKGRGVLWEMYNEPNIGFWKPKPNVEDYILMDKAVAEAIRKAAPGECYFGAATSTIDLKFLESCFQSGALERWDAVSVHPYRQSDPETVASEYRSLRLLIERYKPKNKVIPIISGEWGYSTAWNKFDDERQGKYLPREWMTNLINEVPLSIFYDWHDDGTDEKEAEHNFGTVENQYHENIEPVYDAKPSYTAAKAFTNFFEGYDFNKRLALASPDDYLLLFNKGNDIKLAAWTTKEAHEITLPASPGKFSGVNYLGVTQSTMTAANSGLKLQISDAPLYLEPITANAVLRAGAQWERLPLEMWVKAPNTINLNGKTVFIGRNSVPQNVSESKVVNGVTIRQTSVAVVTNPLHLEISPEGKNLNLKLQNPAREALSGKVSINGGAAQKIVFKAGETEKALVFPIAQQVKARFEGILKNDVVETSARFVPLSAFANLSQENIARNLIARPDGDKQIESEQTLSLAQPAEGASPAGGPSLKLTYRFAPGWKFTNVQPLKEDWKPIEGQPKTLGLWVYGDNSGNVLRLRYQDASGQTFQPNGTSVNWQGWKYFEFPLDATGGHWGGADNGKLHYPIQLESLLIFDSNKSENNRGAIYLSAPTWIY